MTEDTITHYMRATERMRERAETAEARLAVVEALCDEADQYPEPTWPVTRAKGVVRTSQVRAAARGEGDRG